MYKRQFLHHGNEVTELVEARVYFDDKENGYSFKVGKGRNRFIFNHEVLLFPNGVASILTSKNEANITKAEVRNAKTIQTHLESINCLLYTSRCV